MKKILLVILIIFTSFHKTIFAEIWINDDLQIVSDSPGPYEVYIGSMYSWNSFDISIIEYSPGWPMAGSGTTVSAAEFSKHSTVFHMQAGNVPLGTEHFQIETLSPWNACYALYDSSFQIIGYYSKTLDAEVEVYIPSTYQVGPGQSIDLEGYSFNIYAGYIGWVTDADYSQQCYDGWSINETSIPKSVSYEYLTTELGLTAGTYEVRLDAYWDYDSQGLILDDYDTTTITIVPEPASLALFALGAISLLRKRRRQHLLH